MFHVSTSQCCLYTCFNGGFCIPSRSNLSLTIQGLRYSMWRSFYMMTVLTHRDECSCRESDWGCCGRASPTLHSGKMDGNNAQLAYVIVYVPDVNKAAEFYNKAFGLAIRPQNKSNSYAFIATQNPSMKGSHLFSTSLFLEPSFGNQSILSIASNLEVPVLIRLSSFCEDGLKWKLELRH